MIKTIYKELDDYKEGKEGVAVEIRMSPLVYNNCMNCDYSEVSSAFNLSPSSKLPPTTMFNERLVIDFDLDKNEWYVQSPRL